MTDSDSIARLNAALEGRYRIERELGEGGMATVYLADDLKHERKVALKVLKPELAAVVGAERFLAEIKTTANLTHPHILPLFDSGEADGFLFYVMPHIEGESLRDRLDREHQLPVDDAVQIAKNVAEALDYAHRQGVIHRDIKPANILLLDGKPVIADFGIALAVSAGGGHRLTETGLSLGTPHYMSPEQATGDRSVGPPTDIYALGCVLYEVLVGEPPFTGSTPQAILGKIVLGAPESVTAQRKSVPANIDAATARALETLPADRFTSAQAFVQALADPSFRHGGIGVGDGAMARRPGTFWRAALPWGLTAALAATVIVLTSIVLTSRSPALGLNAYAWDFPPEAPMSFTGGSLDGVGWPAFSLSPRGDFLVYVAERGDGTELWYLSLMDVNEARSIDGTEGAYFPMVSPDGEWVAFFSDSQLWKVPIGGGDAVALMEIAPAYESGHWVSMNQILVTDQLATRIRIVDPTTRAIISESGTTRCQLPFLLENGHVLCNRVVPYSARVLDRGSSATRDLQQAGRSAFGSNLRFVSDGYLTFVTAEGALQIATFDPETLQLGRPATVVQSLRREGTSGAAHYAVTPSGALVYAPGENAEVGQLVRRGRGEALSQALDVDPAPFVTFDLSPDGERLAAVVVTIDGTEVRVYDLRTGRTRRWLSAYYLSAPRWSPTGEKLAISATGANGNSVIVVGDPSSGSPPDTVYFAGIPSQFLSEDSLLVRGRLILDISQKPAEVVGRFEDGVLFPTVSPDGGWIAYTRVADGFEVVLEPFPDGGGRSIVGGGQEPVWLSSTELTYRRGQSWYTVSIGDRPGDRPSEPRFWFSDPRFLDRSGMAHVSSRDGGVIYVQGINPSTASFLRVIPNWLEGAKRAADEANRAPN